MGLKEVKFFDWFRGKFPLATQVVARHQGAHFDSVFIDVNCILHPAMRAAKNESMFVKKLYTILDRTLAQFVPDRICYLSVDGPAPLAKLLTQKARRASKARFLDRQAFAYLDRQATAYLDRQVFAYLALE
ncbi:hypothetical protein EC991_007241 [Linnemannia zychae]|nr:hypothetical protein EC991_007241 [Linnemannia zychae]